MKLTDQTVLVTGGASGIGFALSKRFAARGNTVIVCGRDQMKLDAAKSAIPGLHTIRADVTSAAEREKLATTVTHDFPALSVLVNNGKLEIGFRQSEAMRTADRATAEVMFAPMNPPA